MLLSTTNNFEGKEIKEYRGVVFGEVVNGIHIYKDFMASISNITGGRSREYEEELINSRAQAITEMIQRAEQVGANAVIGVKVDLETLEQMLIVVASGTAVIVE